jgi:ABC-type multidrug transport system fused ATPase/permease subunit
MVVPQDPILFDMTLRENVCCSAGRDWPPELLERVADVVQLRDIVAGLPKGWDEPLGPRGGRLSGGEKQRVAIARALLNQPEILILDESTSALDLATENRLLEALADFFRGRTLIFISHRMNPVLWADRIVVIGVRGVAGTGTHEYLYANIPAYKHIIDNNRAAATRSAAPELAVNGLPY